MRGVDGRTGLRLKVALSVVAASVCLFVAETSTVAGSDSRPAMASADTGGGQQVGGSSAGIARRPNIVLIMTDDQSVTDTSVMRHLLARVGSRGTTFTSGFSPYPLCCPARASILTGQYAHNSHVLGNSPPWGGFSAFDDSNTLPMWLQQAGYHTAMLGKYLNGYPDPVDPRYVPPGWDSWLAPVDGIYNYRRWLTNVDATLVEYSGQYQSDYVADQASSLINQYAPSTDPFFLWANFLAPHRGNPIELDDAIANRGRKAMGTPAVARRYRGAMSEARLPRKASINEADVSDKPAYIKSSPTQRRAALTELNQQRLESLLSVDDAVDQILDALRASGELRNTVIIFTSDNGYLLGEHRRIGKVIGYEESTRVPLLISGPGFDTGELRQQKASLVDIAPTIAQLAGARTRLPQDGQSLVPIAADPAADDSRAILLQAGPQRGHVTRWYTGIRTSDYVYVEYNTGESELYNLVDDPLQLDNLVGRADSAEAERTLAAALGELKTCAGATCRASVPELLASARAD